MDRWDWNEAGVGAETTSSARPFQSLMVLHTVTVSVTVTSVRDKRKFPVVCSAEKYEVRLRQ